VQTSMRPSQGMIADRGAGRAATVRSPTPFAGPRVRLTLTRASANCHASDRGVLPFATEEASPC
jgi:hypothetical protein